MQASTRLKKSSPRPNRRSSYQPSVGLGNVAFDFEGDDQFSGHALSQSERRHSGTAIRASRRDQIRAITAHVGAQHVGSAGRV
jgi:hypothetical protein